MAKISANGTVVGTVDYCGKSKRYMSNGKVLVNYGCGWKVGGTVKTGWTPQSAYENAAMPSAVEFWPAGGPDAKNIVQS